jgi:modulator of FtsH protease HflC
MRNGVLIGLALAAVVLYSSIYMLPEGQQALPLRFGRPLAIETAPGLKVKRPFIDTIVYFDTRLLSLEPPTELIILGDQKRIEVDTYTQFRISDPLRFNQSVHTYQQARMQLSQIVGSSLRHVLGQVQLNAILGDGRARIIDTVRSEVAANAKSLGIEVVDVNMRRVDLPPETSSAVHDRMSSERAREATELRAQGFEWAQEIQARADRERTVILAEAQRDAKITRAEGDAEANRLFAEAFGKDPPFFAFYRTMQTYRQALAEAHPTLVLSPNTELLRYFNGDGLSAGAPK